MKNEIEPTKSSGIKLNLKQDLFCKHYTAIGQDTFGIGKDSYEAAGFKSNYPGTAASRLLAKTDIQKRINELYAEIVEIGQLTPELITANIRNIRELALVKGDLTTALAATKLEGQMLALFSESHILRAGAQEPQVREHTESERRALAAAAKVFKLLLHKPIEGETSID